MKYTIRAADICCIYGSELTGYNGTLERICTYRKKRRALAMRKFEKLTVWNDQYDIMCGECAVHEYETWNGVTEAELQKEYEMEKLASEIDRMMTAPADTFEEWLNENIDGGWIRIAE
jgi:hypothetical protein